MIKPFIKVFTDATIKGLTTKQLRRQITYQFGKTTKLLGGIMKGGANTPVDFLTFRTTFGKRTKQYLQRVLKKQNTINQILNKEKSLGKIYGGVEKAFVKFGSRSKLPYFKNTYRMRKFQTEKFKDVFKHKRFAKYGERKLVVPDETFIEAEHYVDNREDFIEFNLNPSEEISEKIKKSHQVFKLNKEIRRSLVEANKITQKIKKR